MGSWAAGLGTSGAQSATRGQATNRIVIVEAEGRVEVSPVGATTWVLTQTNQDLHPFDRVRTGPNSRMGILWTGQETVVSFGSSTELEILPPTSEAPSGLHLLRGILSFFHRDQPGRIRVITRGAVAGVEGTEFVMSVSTVDNAELTTLSVIDGQVSFGNSYAALVLTNGEQAVAEVGKAPVRTAGFVANNLLQWCFYYPAVLDPAELQLTADEQQTLAESLAAYRTGDLLSALARYPAGREPGSDSERVYYAALLLSVGQVEPAQTALASLSAGESIGRPQRLAAALRQLISAVKRQQDPGPSRPELATEFLAGSYYEQSRALPDTSLAIALSMARQAVSVSPEFGFAWARVAELEFSFGRTHAALEALDRSLALTPRHAQALTLKGFLLAAQNHPREAISWFNRALEADSALANAWLGRGLCRIRAGDAAAGREDLLIAAALEPQRAALRSYLGKAYADAGESDRATKELQLAKSLDPQDPTAWLYSALLNQQNSRINEAIRDLEKSQELNDNRSVYRSGLLLDQDQAVRSANLAAMYRDAGMSDVSVREAARAANYDYANYSAHLFLANSYNALRDPNFVNLRYETPAANEYLLAALLAPVSAGALSPMISQQEYSTLFERNRLGVVSTTDYLSRGAWMESGAQYGTLENFGYAVEGFYRSDPGQRVNNDIEQKALGLILQQQITPQDNVYVNLRWYEAESGDLAQYYYQTNANPNARIEESQKPLLGVGYHHEWSPGVHTLFFAARLQDKVTLTNPTQPTLVAFAEASSISDLVSVQGLTMNQQYENNLEIYSAELQQIWQRSAHNTIVGGRVQAGDFDTRNIQNLPSTFGALFNPTNAADQDISTDFRRFSIYGYHQWQILEPLQLTVGLTYDWMEFPENFRTTPISSDEKTEDGFYPKAGLIWTPTKATTVRFAYTQSQGGASIDQSFRLEPSQVAGFIQSYRSLIPESVVGATAGERFETFGLSLEQKFDTGTYLGLSGEILNSEVTRTVGTFAVVDTDLYAVPAGLREHLDFQEQSVLLTANQLLGREWALGTYYRVSHAVLKNNFQDVPDGLLFVNFDPRQRQEALLHQVNLYAIFNHHTGFFVKGEANWYLQDNIGYTPDLAGDDFWQLNAFVGYRFPRRKAAVTLALLNITDQDYQLNPLNVYNELPRERTLAVRLELNF